MRSSKHSEAKKAAVLADVKTLGVAGTARKHGVHTSVIYYWRNNLKSIAKRAVGRPKKAATVVTVAPQFTIQVPIPDHMVREAAAKYLQEKLGLKIVQF
ncbi:MAG: transposase [Pseudomonadota bacterium]